jgi:hypothetical protein
MRDAPGLLRCHAVAILIFWNRALRIKPHRDISKKEWPGLPRWLFCGRSGAEAAAGSVALLEMMRAGEFTPYGNRTQALVASSQPAAQAGAETRLRCSRYYARQLADALLGEETCRVV